MKTTFAGRRFQFWQYRVRHGELLVRSPKDAAHPRNVDLMFAGVEYVDLPRFLPDLEVDEPEDEDLSRAQLRLEEPPDEIGPYSLAYHIKHDIVNPTRKWLANEPQVYLDADNNVRASSVHRDYSHEMAPVLGEVVLMVVPGTKALARGESIAPKVGTVARVDWLRDAPCSEIELFERVVPAPQHGEHSMRGEIITPAFARSVWLTLNGQRVCIRGEQPPSLAWDHTAELHRTIVFSM
jgi:hypothetical protein